MGFGDFLLDIVSFGAHSRGRVKEHLLDCRKAERTARSAWRAFEKQRLSACTTAEELTKAKCDGIVALKRLSRLHPKLRQLRTAAPTHPHIPPSLHIPLKLVNSTLTSADLAFSSVAGAGAGATAALGTWALAGTFGAASTGTAIASLSGAAASNATLALLGGGSLATGGFGMAGGAAVLGGIVIVPIAVISGIVSHLSANSELEKIAAAKRQAQDATGQYRMLTQKLEAVQDRCGGLTGAIRGKCIEFSRLYDNTYKLVFPRGFLSKLWRWLRCLVGRPFFTEADWAAIGPLLAMAAELSSLVDTIVVDENGAVPESQTKEATSRSNYSET